MKTPSRRPNNDPDTITPVLFTARKLKQLLAWSLTNAHGRFGQLVWRQRTGLPAGVPAGVNYANHYFHSFEDAAARPGYNRVYALHKVLQTATTENDAAKYTAAEDAIAETQTSYGLHNNDVRYIDDTLNTTLDSGDEYTAYLRRIYHCNETGLEVEETSTVPKRNGHQPQKASKCEFTDMQFLRSANGDTFRRLFDKNARTRRCSPARSVPLNNSTVMRRQKHLSPALVLTLNEDTTHAAGSRTFKVR